MSLYIYKNNCYTKQERDRLLSRRKSLKKGQFRPLHSDADLNTCKNKLMVEEAEEPFHCSASRTKINKLVSDQIKKYNSSHEISIYTTPFDKDFLLKATSTFLPKLYPHSSISGNDDISVIEAAVKSNPDLDLLIKCAVQTDENAYHSIIIVVKIRSGVVGEISLLDTAPIVESFITLHKLVHTLRMRYRLTIPDSVVVRIPLNEVADEFDIPYTEPILSIQDAERQLARKGYCNAWSLYFTYQMALGKNVYDIYKYMILDNSNAAMTARIMRWWRRHSGITAVDEPRAESKAKRARLNFSAN